MNKHGLKKDFFSWSIHEKEIIYISNTHISRQTRSLSSVRMFPYLAPSKLKVYHVYQDPWNNQNHLLCLDAIVLWTVETPSTNFVRKRTFALLNMPSFNETTMNCKKKFKKKKKHKAIKNDPWLISATTTHPLCVIFIEEHNHFQQFKASHHFMREPSYLRVWEMRFDHSPYVLCVA